MRMQTPLMARCGGTTREILIVSHLDDGIVLVERRLSSRN